MNRKTIGIRAAALIISLALIFCQTALADEITAIEAFPTTDATETAAVRQSTSGAVAVSDGYIEEPDISSQGACLIDAYTGQVLYGKNEYEQFYPASITKVMTALLVLENCSLDEVVTFSSSATTNLESGAVTLNVSEGDQLTVEECLYGLLLKSANEIANGLAEHVSGSVSAFADLMNQRAKSLGCLDTNFVNPNGLTDSSHKTTPYDMCLIMAAALQNSDFRRIDTTLSYRFPAVKNASATTISPGHKMLDPSNTSYYYEGIIGGKTGYLSTAGNTLVTGAERDGVRLVCCVMKSSGTHYTDTKALLDYGFENYTALTGRSAPQASSQVISEGPSSSGNDAVASAGPATAAPAESSGPASGVTVIPSGTDAAVSAAAPGAAMPQTGWVQETDGTWYYYKSDGRYASSEWLTIDGLDYYFEPGGAMAEGWREFADGWYFFRPEIGCVYKDRWIESDGLWYYVGSDGVMLTDTVTPDGYFVDENGVWKEE